MSIQNRYVLFPKILAWSVFIVFLAMSVVVFVLVKTDLENVGRTDLQNKAKLVQQLINDNFKALDIGQSTAFKALFDASDFVTADEFHTFYVARDMQKNFPAIAYVAFARYINQTQTADLIKEIRSQNHSAISDFKIFPETKSNFLTPYVYMEPQSIGTGVVGFDVMSDPIRAAAVNASIDSGNFILSEVEPVRPLNAKGFVGYLAVYNKNITASSTVAERRSNIYGLVATVFTVDGSFGVFDKNLTDIAFKNLDIEVHDGDKVATSTLLYDFNSTGGTIISNNGNDQVINLPLDLGGHKFTLSVLRLNGLIPSDRQSVPYVVLAAEVVISLLVFAFLYLLAVLYTRAYVMAEKMTQDLRESEERYRSLFVYSRDAVMTALPDQGFLSGNPAAIKLFACGDEQNFLSRSPAELSPERQLDGSLSVQKAKELMLSAMKTGSESFEWIHKKCDGTEFWASVLLSRIEMKGEPLLLATVRDISEQKKNEEAIKKVNSELQKSQDALLNVLADIESEKKKAESLARDLNKFKLAVDNVSDQIIITDSDGIILYANKAAEYITGYSLDEIIGKKPSLWGKQMPKDYYVNLWKTIKSDKKIFIGELNNKRKNGDVYVAELKAGPILDDKGSIVFFVSVERDITKIKELEKSKSEFVSITSHQLRTPLTVIKWVCESLLRNKEKNLTLKQIDSLNEIYAGNNRLINIVGDLLSLSRIESGKNVNVNLVETGMSDLIKNSIKALMPAVEQKNISLKLKINLPEGYKLMVDKDKTLQSINNLVSNAINYSESGKGIVIVSAESKNGEFIFSVEDNGIGIPLNAQHRIFERFFRADNAILFQTAGTGLGLPIVKSYIESQGGKVWFESEENKRTTFYFSIKE